MKTTLITALSLIISSTVFGEDSSKTEVPELNDRTVKEALSLFRDIEGLDLSVDSKEKTATFTTNWTLSKDSAFTTKIIGKFDGTDATFASEEGLNNDVTLEIGHKTLYYTLSDAQKSVFNKFHGDIANTIQNAKSGYYGCVTTELTKDYSKYKSLLDLIGSSDESTQKKLWKELPKEIKKHSELEAQVNKNCKSFRDTVTTKTVEISKLQYERKYYFTHYTLAYSPGSYSYFDLENMEQKKSDTESIKIGAEFGNVTLAGSTTDLNRWLTWEATKWSFGAAYSKGDTKGESSKTNICQPLEAAEGFSKCFDTYLKPSYESENLSFFAKAAIRSKSSWLKGVDVEVKHTKSDKRYDDPDDDVSTKRWSLTLPLTVFTNKEYSVRGGLAFKWQQKLKTDKVDFDKFTIGLFITKGFSLSSN